MTCTFVAVPGPSRLSDRVSYSRLYQALPRAGHFENDSVLDNETDPVGWDRRYGVCYFSERALLFGPFAIESEDEEFIHCQMPNFMRKGGKKCIYRLFKAYTAVKLRESGLRARPRDPVNDRIYYFPDHHPDCIALSVQHSTDENSETRAVLVYKFRSPQIAALAFKMLSNTTGVPKRQKASLSRALSPIVPTPLTHTSLHRKASSSGSRTKVVTPRRSRSRRNEIASLPWTKEQSMDPVGPRESREKSPPKLSLNRAKQPSTSAQTRLNHQLQLQQKQLRHSDRCCCNHQCIHHTTDKRFDRADRIPSSLNQPIGKGSLIICNGSKYSINQFRQLKDALDDTGQMSPRRQTRESVSRDSTNSDSNVENNSDSSSNSNIKGDSSRVYCDSMSMSTGSVSCEPVVELASQKLRHSPKLSRTEVTYHDRMPSRNGMRGESGGNPVTVIRLSRQGDSDSQREEDEDIDYLLPTKVPEDGTMVHNLYARQRSLGNTLSLSSESGWKQSDAK